MGYLDRRLLLWENIIYLTKQAKNPSDPFATSINSRENLLIKLKSKLIYTACWVELAHMSFHFHGSGYSGNAENENKLVTIQQRIYNTWIFACSWNEFSNISQKTNMGLRKHKQNNNSKKIIDGDWGSDNSTWAKRRRDRTDSERRCILFCCSATFSHLPLVVLFRKGLETRVVSFWILERWESATVREKWA